MVKTFLTIFLVAWTSQVWAQGWIAPQVNFGTTRLEWGPVSIKASKPTWGVKGGWKFDNIERAWAGASISASVSSKHQTSLPVVTEALEFPFTISGQTFGKKSSGTQNQTQGAQGGSKDTVELDAVWTGASVTATLQTYPWVFSPALRCGYQRLELTARGKIDGKQVEATESITRYYPQVGLAYTHREGPASVSIVGTVGQRSSHLEASLNWNIRPDVWLGVGGKRDYMGFEQGRVESAAFTVKAGMVF